MKRRIATKGTKKRFFVPFVAILLLLKIGVPHDIENPHRAGYCRRSVRCIHTLAETAAAADADHDQLPHAYRTGLAALHREGGRLLCEIRIRCEARFRSAPNR